MAHHGGPDEKAMKDLNDRLSAEFGKQDSSDDITSLMEQLRPRLGATQNFPEAPISEDDEGEIRIGITATGGNVILGFGKYVDWIGFPPEQARALAQSLLDRAKDCDGIEARVRLMSVE